MPHVDFKTRLKKLPISNKIVLIGSFLAMISVFLPWYSDIDKFKSGTTFLGISGPLYLAGLIVFFASLACFSVIAMKLMDKDLPKLPLKECHFYIFNSILSVLMLILSSSVYFHPKFGININDKTMGIGMTLGFIGAIGVFVGGVIDVKKKEIDFEREGELKPLIDVDIQERVQSNLRPDSGLSRTPEQAKEEVQQTVFEEVKSVKVAENNNNRGRDMAQESMRNMLRRDNTNDLNRL